MFDNYSREDLHMAAVVLAARATFFYSHKFSSLRRNSLPISEKVENAAREAWEEAEKLEKTADSEGKSYMIRLNRVYYPHVIEHLHLRMTRPELALMLVLSKLHGEDIPEPVLQLS